MARIKGLAPSQMQGSVGLYTYRMTKHGVVVSEKIQAKGNAARRSLAQAQIRLQMANLFHLFGNFENTLDGAFENKPSNQTDLNAFVKANFNLFPVYLTKDISAMGAAVVAPYQISRGSLPTIQTALMADGVVRSNIALGNLTIDGDTSIAAFSQAVIENNMGYANGDQLSYFSLIQGSITVGDLGGIPMVKVNRYEVTLDILDTTTKLYDVVARYGFSVVTDDNMKFLGCSGIPAVGGLAWVHSRGKGADMKVSTQFIVTNNVASLSSWTGVHALRKAADSYGGYSSAKFLEPGQTTASVIVSEGNDQQTGAVPDGNFSVKAGSATATKATTNRIQLPAGTVEVTLTGTNMNAFNKQVRLDVASSSYGAATTQVALTRGESTGSSVTYTGTITSGYNWLCAVAIDGTAIKAYAAFGSGGDNTMD